MPALGARDGADDAGRACSGRRHRRLLSAEGIVEGILSAEGIVEGIVRCRGVSNANTRSHRSDASGSASNEKVARGGGETPRDTTSGLADELGSSLS